MLPVFTSEEMRSCDSAAIQQYGIHGIVLMENAARGAADFIEESFGPLPGKHCVIVCGKGNNGGDGFAIARHLVNRGVFVNVLNIGPDEAFHGDAKANLDILRKMELETSQLKVSLLSDVIELRHALQAGTAFAVDALLGTGLSSPLVGEIAEIVDTLNDFPVPVVAIDVPTGINSDSGEILGTAVRATITATMGGLKRGLLFGRGRDHAGKVRVIDIGMPHYGFYEKATNTYLLEHSDILYWLPRRKFDVHKYQMGKIFALAGSVGLTGAAVMATEAALRTGAGIVTLGIPERLNPILETKLTEVMTFPLKETTEGTFSLNSYDKILDMVNTSTVSFIGPGISRQYETQNLVRRVILNALSPLVIDADALFALIGHLDLIQTSESEIVLTPHLGEFSRLIDKSTREIESRRVDSARVFATEFGVTLVLKGAPTIIACKDGSVLINPTGNPGMATAGSGDVLTGIIAGLIAQGVPLQQAACCGVYVHGLAGDRATGKVGEFGLIATDMLQTIAETMRELSHDTNKSINWA